jgi:CubicO group peptidase (beta-lactamase class C family)
MLLAGSTWAQSLEPELGPSPPQDVMPLYKDGVDKAVAELPQIIREVMAQSHVPGMAVAVVHGGKVVFEAGYGVRDKTKPALPPVDQFTVFQTASVSKSISATVAAIAMTESQGQNKKNISWDDPVRKYLQDFRLNTQYVSDNATIGDFFAHRSGLPDAAGDDLEDLGFGRNEIIARLRLVPLDRFRNSYHYANFGLTIGAEAVAAAEGEAWESLADRLLFRPLGMTATSYSHEAFAAHADRAALHALADPYGRAEFKPLYDRNPDQQAPAGGVSSNVDDLARWLQLLLAGGQYGGRTLIAPQFLQAALMPQAATLPRPQTAQARSGFYGYGFNVNVNPNGRTSMGHSGAFLLGAGTAFQILPSADVGIVVLTNGAPVGAPEAVAASFMDVVQFGHATRDWYPLVHERIMGLFKPEGDLAGVARPNAPQPAHDLAAYVGDYDSAYFGRATVKREGDSLALFLGPKPTRFPLTHWSGDTFAMTPGGENAPEGSLSSVKFSIEGAGVRAVTINYLDANGLAHFSR